MHAIAWIMVLSGALIAAIGIPLYREQVPPNSLYGFRTPRTLADERVWYPVNKASGFDLMWGGALVVASAMVMGLLFGPGATDGQVVLLAVVPLAPLLAALVRSFWFASTFVAALDGAASAEGAGLPVEEPAASKAESASAKQGERE